jgi:competence protein ComEA
MFHKLASRLTASLATIVVAFFTLTGIAAAAVEANSADASQLESVKGIGPSMSDKIIAARKAGNFKDWSDLETRVSGIGEKNAAKLSHAGLTVGGHAKEGAPADPDAGHAAKTAGKTATKKTALDGSGTSVVSGKKVASAHD